MGIGPEDYIDKMLVEKYSDERTCVTYGGFRNMKAWHFEPGKYQTSVNFDKYLKNYDTQANYDEYCTKFDTMQESLKNLKKHPKLNKNKIEQLEKDMKSLNNPNKMYERLGVDLLSITVSGTLLPIADPNMGGKLLSGILLLRYKLTDCIGYIIPNIRVMDSSKLGDNEYVIAVRGQAVFKGKLEENLSNEEKISKMMSELEEICFKYVKQIFTKTDTLKLLELVRSQDPTLVNDICPDVLSVIDLKNIFIDLIEKKIAIKDIIAVFEILNDYARFTQNTDELVMILAKELTFQPPECA